MHMMGFQCRSCGELHDELPMSFHADMPEAWAQLDSDPSGDRSFLSSDQCEIDGARFFLRGLLRIPVEGLDETLDWGVWFEVPPDAYERFCDLWDTEGREAEPPHRATIATRLPLYPETIGLTVEVRTRPVGDRPWLVVTDARHPLAREQSGGITRARLQEIWAQLLHTD
jgi:hypothetical protein